MEFHTEDEGEQDLSEEQINSLLEEASARLRQKAASGTQTSDIQLLQLDSIRFPKLNPGTLPRPYIQATGSISRITLSPITVTTATTHLSINDPVVVVKKKQPDSEPTTAGKLWFDMPLTSTDPQTTRDIKIIQMREALDPHRHYKKNILKRVPKYSQMGTIITHHSEFYSARLTNRERKGTILEEIMSDARTTARLKQKRHELDAKSSEGGRMHYRKMKEKRRKK